MSKSSRNWKLHQVHNLDTEWATKIASFLESFRDEDRDRKKISPEYFLWKLRDNPAGRGIVSLALNNGRVVGTTTATPKRIISNEKQYKVLEIGDTYTDPEFQRQGIFSGLVNATVERSNNEGYESIYGTPNENSLPGYENKLGFKRVSKLGLCLWVFPINIGAALTNSNSDKKHTKEVLSKISAFYAGIGKPSANVTEIKLTESLDPLSNVDKIAGDQAKKFRLVRDLEYLNYRIVENPERDRYCIFVHTSGSYIATKITTERGLSTLFVADLVADSTHAARDLWCTAVHSALDKKCDIVATWLPKNKNTFISLLPKLALPRGKKEVIFNNQGFGSNVLQCNSSDMLFSIMDSDNV